jgi:hypothetical protein
MDGWWRRPWQSSRGGNALQAYTGSSDGRPPCAAVLHGLCHTNEKVGWGGWGWEEGGTWEDTPLSVECAFEPPIGHCIIHILDDICCVEPQWR